MPREGVDAAPEPTRTSGRRRAAAAARTVPPTGDDTPGLSEIIGMPTTAAGAEQTSSVVIRQADPAVQAGTIRYVRNGEAGSDLPAGPHPVELAGLLHELSALLLGADDVRQALDRLAAFAAAAVPGALRCSVSLIGEGGPPALAASGSRAQALDDLQYAEGHGPGLEAARTQALVTAPELQTDPRWPALAERARAEGVHGIVAIPMDVQRSSVGSLSLFVGPPGGVDPELLLTAMAVVNQAEVLLGELRRREGLREGATVDRAAGVIIAQRGCGVQEAYDVLRETAQRLGLDRRIVAERLIAAAARNADAIAAAARNAEA